MGYKKFWVLNTQSHRNILRINDTTADSTSRVFKVSTIALVAGKHFCRHHLITRKWKTVALWISTVSKFHTTAVMAYTYKFRCTSSRCQYVTRQLAWSVEACPSCVILKRKPEPEELQYRFDESYYVDYISTNSLLHHPDILRTLLARSTVLLRWWHKVTHFTCPALLNKFIRCKINPVP